MDNAGVGRVATNTTLAACTGGLAAIFVMWFQTKKWDTTAIINGFLAGLVGITCPCYWVSGLGACIIGAVAGVLVILGDGTARTPPHRRSGWRLAGSRRVRYLGHAVAGPVCQRRVFRGRFEPVRCAVDRAQLAGCPHRPVLRRRPKVLAAQCVGSVIVCTATFASAMAMFAALNAFGLLRVSKEGELVGLDIDQHGISAYPEYVISAAEASSSETVRSIDMASKTARA